jgi:MFS family permease
LIAFGTGGIKPCVSAHGGDQFLPEQTNALNQFYSVFYIAINLGSLIAGFVVPVIKESQCFGTEKDCYSYAFLACAGVFLLSYFLFIFGKRYYRVVPPAGRFIIYDLLKAWVYKLFAGQQRAQEVFGKSILVEASDLGKVLFAILPTPIFWMGFNQNGKLCVNL